MQTIEQLKQQRETLLQLADQVYAQIQEEERKQEKPKVKIELGDFAFHEGHAYLIVQNTHFGTVDKFVGFRFAFHNYGKNKVSWLELSDDRVEGFAKFNISENLVLKYSREDCDLSALGL